MLSPAEHELGEDFLRHKLDQLDWLFSESPQLDWSLSVVDDGCPCASGALARQIIETTHRAERARVLYLPEGIEAGHPQVASLGSVEESQKGGSILYGMARAIDIELLLKTALRRKDSIARVPIAWVDSEAASTTTDLEPYLPMLKAVVRMYRRWVPADARADGFAHFLAELDEGAWNRFATNVPPVIADGDPTTFGHFDGVSVDVLKECARA